MKVKETGEIEYFTCQLRNVIMLFDVRADQQTGPLNEWMHLRIGVGRGPSGLLCEGLFCRTVRLCRALETEK